MTLAQSTIDYFTALLFRDYLALSHADWMALLSRTPTAESAALDIPDALPRHGMDRGKDVIYPSLIIAAKEADGNTPAKRVLNVSCYLPTWLKAADANAADVPEQLTREQSAGVQVAVENRLRDRESFYTWLATLDAERLKGWSIMSRLQIANAAPARNKTERTIDFATTITLTIAVGRLVNA